MNRKIFFPGTFDPITNGHLNLIQKASDLFDEVIVGVAQAVVKQTYFSFEQRLALVTAAVAPLSRVSAKGFSGFSVVACRVEGACAMLRGVRGSGDFEYECQLAQVNHQVDSTISTIFLMPDPAYLFVSASMVREIARLGGSIETFVPEVVQRAFG